MTRSFSFLVNPSSGGGAAPEAVVPVARLLRDAGATVDVTYSPGPKAMAGLVSPRWSAATWWSPSAATGCCRRWPASVSVAGGTLAVLPAGRGNDFARMLGLPESPDDLAKLLLEADPRQVDLLSLSLPGAGERRVAGSVYSGVDARASEIVDRAHWLPQQAAVSLRRDPLAGDVPSRSLPGHRRRHGRGVLRRQRWWSPTPATTARA